MRTAAPFPSSETASHAPNAWSEPTEFSPASAQPMRRHRDEDLMYAWSLQDPTQASEVIVPVRHDEECPPEVYIG